MKGKDINVTINDFGVIDLKYYESEDVVYTTLLMYSTNAYYMFIDIEDDNMQYVIYDSECNEVRSASWTIDTKEWNLRINFYINEAIDMANKYLELGKPYRFMVGSGTSKFWEAIEKGNIEALKKLSIKYKFIEEEKSDQ